MLLLWTGQGFAHMVQDKAEALRARFYPGVKADLTNIADTTFGDDTFPNPIQIDNTVSPD
jgi:hypothetical protein